MHEIFNSQTTLIMLNCLASHNTTYFNASILSFSLVASINHFLPENLEGMTHVVKMLVTNILFSMLKLNPLIGLLISLIDISPLLGKKNKAIVKAGELAVQIPRQLIEMFLIYQIYLDGMTYRAGFIILSKVIYFLERRDRINKGERNNFGLLHSFEHFGLYCLVSSYMGLRFDLYFSFKLFWVYVICYIIALYVINVYIHTNVMNRIPFWVKESKELYPILKNKLYRNKSQGKWHNYLCKPWTNHLKLEFVTWSNLENSCKILSDRIDPNEFDCIVGIKTGGAFVAAYIAHLLNKPYFIVSSKLWSGSTFLNNTKKAIDFFSGKEVKADIYGEPEISGMRILLCDDTTYTGITITQCVDYCQTKLKAKSVKTLCIWISDRFIPDYYIKSKRVPIIWEWGVELD